MTFYGGSSETKLRHHGPAARVAASTLVQRVPTWPHRKASGGAFETAGQYGASVSGESGDCRVPEPRWRRYASPRHCLPYLRELNQQTRETIHLTVRHGLSAVYVEKLDSPEPVRIHSRIGAAVPLHCTAVGKVMLAYMSPEEQDRTISQIDLKRQTPNSVGNVQELKTELYRVRKNGYACDLEEHELHIRCVAAPIWDHTGSVQSSVSITAPTLRMPVTRLRQLAPMIQAAGLNISTELGYQSAVSASPVTVRNRNGKTGLVKMAM